MINSIGFALIAWSGGMLVTVLSIFYQARTLNLGLWVPHGKRKLAKEMKRAACIMLGAAIALFGVGIGIIIVSTFSR